MILDGFDYGEGYTRAVNFSEDLERFTLAANGWSRQWVEDNCNDQFSFEYNMRSCFIFRRKISDKEKENPQTITILLSEFQELMHSRFLREYDRLVKESKNVT